MSSISTEDLERLYAMFDKQDRLVERLLTSVDQLTATLVAVTQLIPEEGPPTTIMEAPRFLGEGEQS